CRLRRDMIRASRRRESLRRRRVENWKFEMSGEGLEASSASRSTFGATIGGTPQIVTARKAPVVIPAMATFCLRRHDAGEANEWKQSSQYCQKEKSYSNGRDVNRSDSPVGRGLRIMP